MPSFYPYTNFHELNLEWFMTHFEEIFQQWDALYQQMQTLGTQLQDSYDQFSADVLASYAQFTADITEQMTVWETNTEADISDWETATLAALDAWKTAFETLFNSTFSDLEDIKTDAEAARDAAIAAQEAAEAAAASFQTDKTLSVEDDPADAYVTGLNFDYLKDALTVSYRVYADSFIDGATGLDSQDRVRYFQINSAGNWALATSANTVTAFYQIPPGTRQVRITMQSGGYIAFLNSIDNIEAATPCDFAEDYPARIGYVDSNEHTYQILPDMNYIYILRSGSNGVTVTPTIYNDQYVEAGKIAYMTAANATSIASGTDYDTFDTQGVYTCNTEAIAESLLHCPTTSPHRLFVFDSIKLANSRITQLIITASATPAVWIRYCRDHTPFGDWIRISAGLIPENTAYSRKMDLMISRAQTKAPIVYSTLPKENNTLGVTDYYAEGDELQGVPYSSVWRDGLDVFRNLTLETFYSALANPASVLYTKNYTDMNVANAHCWYGAVCSTYITQLIGRRLFFTTDYLYTNLTDKESQSIYDLEVGDLIVSDNHEMIISNAYTDSFGVLKGMDVSEEVSIPSDNVRTTRTVYRQMTGTSTSMDHLINDFSYKIKQNPTSIVKEFDIPEFNKKVIYAKGNNTYLTPAEILSDGVWLYMPGVSTMYWKKDNGSWASVTVSSLPSDTVNGVTVYNVGSLMSGVGDYYFTDNTSNKPCFLKVIDFGTITLVGNTLTISGWQNCKPYNYYTVVERVAGANSFKGMNPTSGYYCHFTNRGAEINLDPGDTSTEITIPSDMLENNGTPYDRYKMWVEYDTGIGYAQAFSNLVVIS